MATTAIRNRSIDWAIVADQEVSGSSNIEVFQTTIPEVRARFQDHFNFNIALPQPYKLCDFKPAYGELFSSLISGYDYWGHVDLDVIWGNFNHFLTAEMLSSSDKIFGGGHLSLFRNDRALNGMFRKTTRYNALSYDAVFSSEKSYAFDEWGPQLNGMNAIVSDNGLV